MQVVRLWSDRWGARLLPAVRARAREGRVKSEAGLALDRAPSSSFARAIRGGFGDCSEGRGRCGAMGLHVVKVVPLLRKGLIASRAHARRSSKGRISNLPPPIRVHARETYGKPHFLTFAQI